MRVLFGGTLPLVLTAMVASLSGYHGLLGADCNGNGIEDSIEIADGTALDCNQNDIPDVCDLQTADLVFDGPRTFRGGSGHLAAEDFDGDGDLDIAVADFANGNQGRISVLEGRGNGSFEPAWGFLAGEGPTSIVAIDVDGNGRPDLLYINRPGTHVVVLNETPSPLGVDCDANGVPDACDVEANPDIDCNENGIPDACDLASGVLTDENEDGIPDACEEAGCQVPGDCNQDARLDMADAVCVLGFLFQGDLPRLPCGDGTKEHEANILLLDWRPDGRVDMSDPISILRFLFLDGPPHPLAVSGEEVSACVPIFECPR